MSNRFPADDEHLHPYPGNLKHHKVDKKEQRKLLCEMMEDDAKSGLYNEKKPEPLLSAEKLVDEFCEVHPYHAQLYAKQTACWVRDFYEAARAKDAERIEQLEALCRAMGNGLDEMMRPANRECNGAHCTGCWKDINGQLVKLLFAAGFKPTEP